MKFKFIYTTLFLGFTAFMFMANSGGRATVASTGNTGAPGDDASTCITCHATSASLQVTLDIDLLDTNGNSVATSGYMPGNDYTLKVLVNPAVGTPAAYGFQAVCLNGAQGEDAADVSAYSNPSANVQIASAMGRTYVEHNGASASNEFTVTWSAPSDLTGPVTFYSCGNGVNNTGSTAGDGAGCNVLTIEMFTVGTNQVVDAVRFEVAPNPVTDYMQVVIDGTQQQYKTRIINILGKQVYQATLQNGVQDINFEFLPKGSYFLTIESGQQILTKKILKL